MKIKKKIRHFFKKIKEKILQKYESVKEVITQANGKVICSMLIMGSGQLLYKRWVKGFLYLFAQILFYLYFIWR